MAESISSPIFQLKVTLKDIHPPIWRRIQVPADYNFRELHLALQCAMGWFNEHLYQFRVKTKGRFGVEELFVGKPEEFDSYLNKYGPKTVDATTVKLPTHFPQEKAWVTYDYDFGDSWEHRVELEKILTKEEGVTYPRCIAGRRACPPENCGSTSGYYRHLEIYGNPQHPDYKSHMEWCEENGASGDPAKFDPKSVEFDLEDIDRELFYAKMEQKMAESRQKNADECAGTSSADECSADNSDKCDSSASDDQYSTGNSDECDTSDPDD